MTSSDKSNDPARQAILDPDSDLPETETEGLPQLREWKSIDPVFGYSDGSSRRRVSPHETGWSSWGRVFANPTAVAGPVDGVYPEGAMFVREKLPTEDAATPSVVTVLAKRAKGFSPKTGDWEYFELNGSDLAVIERQKEGSCSKCHAGAKNSDWVFGRYSKP